MTHTDDALTEAVAKAIYDEDLKIFEDDIVFPWELVKLRWMRMARTAIAAVRAHDEQAALNCGFCDPNSDEIACACQIKERVMNETERAALVEELVGIWDHAATHYNDEFKSPRPVSKHAAISEAVGRIDRLLALAPQNRRVTMLTDTEVLIPYSDDYPDVMKDSFGHIWEIRACQADGCLFYDDDCALQGYPPSGNPGPASFIFQGTPDPTLLCEMCYGGDEVQKDGVWYALHREDATDER